MMFMRIFVLAGLFVLCFFPVVEASVLDGAIEFNGHYYKSFEMKIEWKNAQAFCESMGGHLVTIESKEEQQIAVKTIVNGHQDKYWIGAYKDKNQMYRWYSGKMITEFYWEPGEPRGTDDNICIKKESGLWAVYPTYYNHSIICEWDSASSAHDSNL